MKMNERNVEMEDVERRRTTEDAERGEDIRIILRALIHSNASKRSLCTLLTNVL